MEYAIDTTCVPYCNVSAVNDTKSAADTVITALMQNPQIEFCNMAVCGARAIIGVIPYPLFSRSEREELERAIAKEAYSLYDFDEVVVSFDTDVIYRLSKSDGTDMEKKVFDDLFESVKNRRSVSMQ